MKIFNFISNNPIFPRKLSAILLPLVALSVLLLACSTPSDSDSAITKTKTKVTLTSSSAILNAVKDTKVDKITITKKPDGATGKWSISPKLPDGLALTGEENADTATLGGTPTEISEKKKYTVTFTGSGDFGSASTIIEVQVTDAPLTPVTLTKPEKLLATKDTEIKRGISIVKSPTGATGVFSVVEKTLPAGLEIDKTTGAIKGTPRAVSSSTTYKIKFTGNGGYGDATTTIDIEVTKLPTLSLSANENKTSITVDKGTQLPKVTITLSGADAKGSWSISPTPHSDLTFTGANDSTTATITGTPGTAQVNTPYTITFMPDSLAEYANTIAPTITINIKVSTPVSIDETVIDLLADGNPITESPSIPTTPPDATGVFSGTLPGGLTLNGDGTITGTPVPSVTKTSGEDGNDGYTVTFTGSGVFGDTSKKVIVKVYKYKPADKAALIIARNTEMAAEPTGQGADADLNLIDTSAVTDMSVLFADTLGRTFEGDVSKWDVSSVINMSQMFDGAGKFNNDLSKWNVGKVKSMANMFSSALAFNGDIRNWNVSKVESMQNMFNIAFVFNQDISGWDVGAVTNMLQLFLNAREFNQDLTDWKDHIQTGIDVRYLFSDTKVTGALVPCWLDESTEPDSVDTSSC